MVLIAVPRLLISFPPVNATRADRSPLVAILPTLEFSDSNRELTDLVSSQLLSSNAVHCPSAPQTSGVSYTYCRGYTPKNIYRILAFDADGQRLQSS